MSEYPGTAVVEEYVQMMLEADDGKQWLGDGPSIEEFLRDIVKLFNGDAQGFHVQLADGASTGLDASHRAQKIGRGQGLSARSR